MVPKLWPGFLIFMYLENLGYSMVVYLATITGIDKRYYEAACIDGASVWQQMKWVTLPAHAYCHYHDVHHGGGP